MNEIFEIDLGEFGRVQARALCPFDFAVIGPQPDGPANEKSAEWMAYGLQIQKAILTRCLGEIKKGSKVTKIVDKPFDQCKPGELSADLVPAPVVEDIQRAVMGAGLPEGKEAVQDAGFPEKE